MRSSLLAAPFALVLPRSCVACGSDCTPTYLRCQCSPGLSKDLLYRLYRPFVPLFPLRPLAHTFLPPQRQVHNPVPQPFGALVFLALHTSKPARQRRIQVASLNPLLQSPSRHTTPP